MNFCGEQRSASVAALGVGKDGRELVAAHPRERVAGAQAPAAGARPARCSSASAARWPKVSLTALNLVDVEKLWQCHRRAFAPRSADRRLQAIGEHQAVGQVGQGIVLQEVAHLGL
jgi:hypothetical protein